MDTFLLELAKSGPWALVAGFLLWQLLRDKAADREMLTSFLTEFSKTQAKIMSEVGDIAESLKTLVTELRDDRSAPTRRG